MTERQDQWLRVDRVIHEPARLLLMALLYPAEAADFTYLLRRTGLTRGNLSAHLIRLEQAGYVETTKGYRGRVPHTTYCLTEAGRTAFRGYRQQVQQMLTLATGEADGLLQPSIPSMEALS